MSVTVPVALALVPVLVHRGMRLGLVGGDTTGDTNAAEGVAAVAVGALVAAMEVMAAVAIEVVPAIATTLSTVDVDSVASATTSATFGVVSTSV